MEHQVVYDILNDFNFDNNELEFRVKHRMQVALESTAANQQTFLEVQSEEEEVLNPLLVAEYDALRQEDFNLYEKLRGDEGFNEKAPDDSKQETSLLEGGKQET